MIGGAGRYLARLVDLLDESKKEIWAPADQKYNNKQIIPVKFFYRFFWPNWLRGLLFVIHRTRQQHITHLVCNNILPLGTIAYITSLITQVKYTVIVHGMDITVPLQMKAQWKLFLLKKIINRADSVIVNSKFTESYAQRVTEDRSKIFIIPPPAYCTPDRTQPHEPIFAPQLAGKKFILSVGRLVKRKNYDMVLDVARTVVKTNPEVFFVIAGDGPEYEHLKNRISEEHLELFILLHKNVTDSELHWLYRNCAVHLFIPLLLPNGDSEGFGIVALEACAFAKPTIASKSSGATDIIEHEVNGLLVDPANNEAIVHACKSLLTDDSARIRMGEKAKQIFETKFSEKNTRSIVASILGFQQAEISVVIPAYNAEKTIIGCLESLAKQSCPPKEIIVVDDGSTDRTDELLQSWKTNPIRVIKQANAGAPVARNKGAKHASGEWLLFLDADIVMDPDMLQTLYRLTKTKNQIDFIYSRFYFGWKKFPSFQFDPILLKKMNYIHTSSLIRKKAFPGFDESLKRHQDWDLWLTMTDQGSKGILCEKYLYRIQPQKFRISTWIPSFLYKLPFASKLFAPVKAYEDTAMIVRKKHNLI